MKKSLSINIYQGLVFGLFIKKGLEPLTDEICLGLLNVSKPKRIELNSSHKEHYSKIFINEDENWLHIIDDSHNLIIQRNIQKIEKNIITKYDLAYCYIDDVGPHAFEITYFQEGILRRRYEVEISKKVRSDIGKKIENESHAFQEKDNYGKALKMLELLNINLGVNSNKIRCYEHFNPNDFVFNESEY